MPCTMIIAKVKKMDITNKVTAENWSQTITITLSDIELNDENLIAIRKFRPNEDVKVHLETLQLSLEEIVERERLKKLYPTHGELCPVNDPKENVSKEDDIEEATMDDEDEDLFDLDYDETLPDTDKILKTFDFSKILLYNVLPVTYPHVIHSLSTGSFVGKEEILWPL